jgi:hypothetical protein
MPKSSQAAEYETALRAVLLFHSGCAWTPDVRSEWKELTGFDEASTKTLCDTVRAALAGSPSRPDNLSTGSPLSDSDEH